jgi:sortase (surface protein transpeptidase)
VIVGHLDTSTGPGVFARLGTLRRGAGVRVTDRRGVVHRYRVVGKAVVRKASFASAGVFGASRHPVLVLVTCGGTFRRPGGYRDNVLVYARA